MEQHRQAQEELVATLADETALKERLESFQAQLEGGAVMWEFDAEVFEKIIEKVIMGGYEDDGTPSPFMITFVFKTGMRSKVDCSDEKTNGNIKKTYSQQAPNPCGVRGKTAKDGYAVIMAGAAN